MPVTEALNGLREELIKLINSIIVSKRFPYDGIDYEYFGVMNEIQFEQTPWYEFVLLDYLRSLNKEGVYIDVGGNLGNHSLFFINHCKATKLHTFEPESFCHSIVRVNLETNATKEFKLHKLAAWDKEADLKMMRFVSLDNTGTSSVVEVDDPKDADVKANSLDNVIPKDDDVVLIKIDVEGSEPRVLAGAEMLIKKNLPVIICEAATDPELKAINDILIPWGYIEPTQRFNATPTYVWLPK